MNNERDPFWVAGDVARYFGRSRATVWRWVKRGFFPPPVRDHDGRFLGWPRSEIVRWKMDLARRAAKDWQF